MLGSWLVPVALAAVPAHALDLAVGVDAGYAFRSQSDGRNHGAAAALFVDVPLPLWPRSPLALRPEIVSLGFGGSHAAPSTLGLFAGALSLVYSFDDSDVLALGAVGPLAGAAVNDGVVEAVAGVLASLGLRVPVAAAASVEARILSPFIVYGPRGVTAPGQGVHEDGSLVVFPLQAAFLFGLTIDIERALMMAADGQGPAGFLPAVEGHQ